MAMEWKMLGIRGKLGSAKQKVLKVFRLISGLGKEDYSVTSPTPVITVAPDEPVNSLRNHSLEAELKKAEALMYWQMLLDRPK